MKAHRHIPKVQRKYSYLIGHPVPDGCDPRADALGDPRERGHDSVWAAGGFGDDCKGRRKRLAPRTHELMIGKRDRHRHLAACAMFDTASNRPILLDNSTNMMGYLQPIVAPQFS
jgi:hypothetical protein